MGESKKVRLAGITWDSLVNGPGIRCVLFAQGCKHNCEECFNPHTHSFTEGRMCDMDDVIAKISDNPLSRGVTFSGGDPWEQAEEFAYIAENVKRAGKNIWSYTGYTFEYILKHQTDRRGWRELLKNVDVLVDGKFNLKEKEEGLKFKGSKNQRVIDVRKSLQSGKVIELQFEEQ